MGYFLFHGGSADHASEDRVRGICQLLPEQPEICTEAPEEDCTFKLENAQGVVVAYQNITAGTTKVTITVTGSGKQSYNYYYSYQDGGESEWIPYEVNFDE